jgi:hypothetical protein
MNESNVDAVRKPAAAAPAEKPTARLLTPSEVAEMFPCNAGGLKLARRPRLSSLFVNEQILAGSELGQALVNAASVPAESVDRFVADVSISIDAYLDLAPQPDPGEIQGRVSPLAAVAEKALAGDPRKSGLQNPAAEGVAANDAMRRDEAIHPLRGLCVPSEERRPGRKRPSGRQSRKAVEYALADPAVERGRPANEAELELCAMLAIDYREATGRTPIRNRRDDARGAFEGLVELVLRAVGSGANPDWLVRSYHEQWAEAHDDHVAG